MADSRLRRARRRKTVAPRTSLSRRAVLPAFLLLLACVAVYLPSLRSQFIWDDDVLITANPLVQSLSGLPGIWRGEGNPDYFPLTSTLFWLEDRLWGLNPMGFHLTNILLHGCAAILLWRVLLRLRLRWPWLAALLFAVHPVAVGTVAWIAEGKNTLSMVMALAALLQYLKWRDAENGPMARRACVLSFAFFLLALLSKTSVVTLPLLFILCDWWLRRRILPRDILRLTPFLALSILFAGITLRFQSVRAIAGADIPIGGPFARFCAVGKALCFYALKLLVPVHLGVIYPSFSHDPPSMLDALPALLILFAFAISWKFRRNASARGFLFGFGVFCIALLPVIGLVKMYYLVFAPVADHLQYFAIPAFLAMAVGSIGALTETAGVSRVVPWGLGCVAAAFAMQSFFHTATYEDQATLWGAAVRDVPHSFLVQQQYALVLAREGDLPEAVEHCQEAVRLNPAFLKSRLNLAVMLDQGHRLDESIAAFRDALRLDPNVSDAHLGLGNVLFEKRLPGEAALEYQQAIRLNPGNCDAHQNLGVVLENAGQADAAIEQYAIASQLRPDNVTNRMALGRLLLLGGRATEAAEQFRQILRIDPDNQQAQQDFNGATGAPHR